MTEVGGPGDKAQKFATQVSQKAQKIRTQAMAKAPQLTGPLAQKAQRVVQEKPGTAAAGVVLAVLGLLVLRRRPRRRVTVKKAQRVRGHSRMRRVRRWTQALAVLGLLIRRRRRRRGEDS